VLARATAFQFAWLRRSSQRRRMRFDLAIREHEIGQQPLANREALAPFEERPIHPRPAQRRVGADSRTEMSDRRIGQYLGGSAARTASQKSFRQHRPRIDFFDPNSP
jgi:hypothetical protein